MMNMTQTIDVDQAIVAPAVTTRLFRRPGERPARIIEHADGTTTVAEA